MFYTAAWCFTNENDFKKSIPFDLLGESIKRYDSTIPFHIVILEGIHLLSDSYLSNLRSLGFTIIDYSEDFKGILKQYESIGRFYSRYERNCFLRWIAFARIKDAHKNFQFWHLDGDIILHTSLNSLADDTFGKTFMLQGCPVFVSISNFSWFECYERELNSLESDIMGYSQMARNQKDTCKSNDISYANESSFRYPIGSDQDLLEYLVSSKRIFQETASTIFYSKFYYIQNPLSIRKWHSYQIDPNSKFEEDSNLGIKIGNKKVPFVHYQNVFSEYASLYCFQRKMGISNKLIRKILRFEIVGSEFKVGLYYKILMRMKKWCEGINRERTIKIFIGRNPLLIDLLNLLLAK